MARVLEIISVLSVLVTSLYYMKKHFEIRRMRLQDDREMTKLLLTTLQEKSSQKVKMVLDVHSKKMTREQQELLLAYYDDLVIEEHDNHRRV